MFSEKDITTSFDRSEATRRDVIARKLDQMICLMMNAGTKVEGAASRKLSLPEEPVGELKSEDGGAYTIINDDLNRERINVSPYFAAFDVNVCGVQTVKSKATLHRTTMHAEFIISTQTNAGKLYVAKRFKDFRYLRSKVS